MKKFTFVFSIAVLVCVTCVMVFSHHEKKNRYASIMQLVINSTYDPYYTSATFESVDRTGTDGEGPLYSTASTWSGLSDNGYEWQRTIFTDKNNPPSCWPENRRWVTTSGNNGMWETKDYDERFAVSSYAYVSASPDNDQYETSYSLYAEVHSDFQQINIRSKHPPQPRTGSFSDSVFRWGDVDGPKHGGWRYSNNFEQSSLVARAETYPYWDQEHKTSAEAPENANLIDVVCDYCDDAGCSKCNDHREPSSGDSNTGIGNNNTDPSNTGISLANSNQTPRPGDSVTLNLVTSEPYYTVDWYVKAPWDTSGTYIESDSGDGTSTEASLTYVFPSGVMNTGDFLFTASIYRWSDMSWHGDETHTVSVSDSPPVETTPALSYSLVSSDGVYTATAGTGHESNFTTNEAYTSVYWYVKSPGDTSSYGTNVTTESGDGSKMTSQLDYSFPSGVSGDYQFLAYVYSSGGSVYETSYTVSVSLP